MKKTFIFIILLLSQNGFSQKNLKARFILRFIPDNVWLLRLYKDNTYEYHLWSEWSNKINVLDFGTYQMTKDKLTFQSLKNDIIIENNLSNDTFFVKTLKIRKKQEIESSDDFHLDVFYKNFFFRRKVIILCRGKNFDFKIVKEKE
jgi:hypothetical protein